MKRTIVVFFVRAGAYLSPAAQMLLSVLKDDGTILLG